MRSLLGEVMAEERRGIVPGEISMRQLPRSDELRRLSGIPAEDGFTLIEVLVAMAVSAIVLTAAVYGLTNAFQQSTKITSRVTATAEAETQFGALTRDLRDAEPCPANLQSADLVVSGTTSAPTISMCDPVGPFLTGGAAPTSYVPSLGLITWACNSTTETCTRTVSGATVTADNGETASVSGVTSLSLSTLTGALASGSYSLTSVSWVGFTAQVAQLEYPSVAGNLTQVAGTSPFTITTGVALRNYGT